MIFRQFLPVALMLVAGCSESGGEPAIGSGKDPPLAPAGENGAAEPADSYLRDTSQSDPVPGELLGKWVSSHEECEEEGEPSAGDFSATITFAADRTYRAEVKGWSDSNDTFRDTPMPKAGTYTFDAGEYPRITLDNWLNFNVEGDTLQNWSEGEAVYLCGAVFVRESR